jgi:multiple sugar transport system permease protein
VGFAFVIQVDNPPPGAPPAPAEPPGKSKARFGQRFNRMEEAPFGLLLLAPAALLMLLINFLPLLYAIRTSFQKVQLTASSERPWVGFKNYRTILHDPIFWESVVRTIWFAAVVIVVGTTISMITALTLNERFPGRSIARVVLLLPWAVASLVTGVMWNYLFNGKFGVVNAILKELGLIDRYIDFLGDSRRALIIAAVATAWKLIPFLSLMLLASMQSIPDALYRSAKMDGANVWKRFTVITFPHLRTVFSVIIVYQIVAALLAFDLIYGFTQGGPGYGTTVINYLIYINAFQRLNLGVASAMALLLTMLIIGISGISLAIIAGRRKRS